MRSVTDSAFANSRCSVGLSRRLTLSGRADMPAVLLGAGSGARGVGAALQPVFGLSH